MREDGFYWIKPSYSHWKVAQHVQGTWFLPGSVEGLTDADLMEIDERPVVRGPVPVEPTQEMVEAGYRALRNSSWHEASPTELDLIFSDWAPIFKEVFADMEAERPVGAADAWERRQSPQHGWVVCDAEDLSHYRDRVGQDVRPLFAGAIIVGRGPQGDL